MNKENQLYLVKPKTQGKRSGEMEKLMQLVEAEAVGNYDLSTPVKALDFQDHGGFAPILVDREHEQNLTLNDWSFGQVCTKLGMPARYMKKVPVNLQLPHFNHWLEKVRKEDESKKMLLRCKQNGTNVLRAFLSSKYSILNNREMLNLMYDSCKNMEWPWEIKQSHLSDRSMVARIVFGDQQIELNGDNLKPGLAIVNSEIGAAPIIFGFMLYRVICTNGMVIGDEIWQVRKRHIGIDPEAIQERIAVFLEDLPRIVKEMGHIVQIATEKDVREAQIVSLRAKIGKDFMEKALDTVAQEYGDKVTYWALANAISRRSQDSVDAERRIEYDQFAGEVLLKAA